MDYRSTSKTVFAAHYHIIFCPKYRRRVLVGPVARQLAAIIREVCAEHQADILGLEVMPDHVHLLVDLPPAVALSHFLQRLKGRSSRRLRQEFPSLQRLPTLWTRSWFVATVGGAPLAVVQRYVEQQKAVAAR